MLKICENCGKEFDAKAYNAKICYDCRIRKCVICGKEFNNKKFYVKTCSKQCANKLIQQNSIKTYQETRNCKYCNKEFICKNTSKKLFCSTSCSMKYLNKTGQIQSPFSRKDIQEKCKQTMIERYGVNHIFKRKDIIEKNKLNFAKNKEEIINKQKQTKLEKYGNENYNNIEKAKITNLERYGVDNPWKNKEVQSKIRKTMQDRYGKNYYTETNDILNKLKESMQNKYGVDYPAQSNEVYNKLRKTNLKKYGVEYSCLTDNCINSTHNIISNLNISISNLLKEKGINCEFEKRIINSSYDLYLPDKEILLEIE